MVVRLRANPDLHDQLELYLDEMVYDVIHKDKVIGSLTIWNDKTKSFYDYTTDTDHTITNIKEISNIII